MTKATIMRPDPAFQVHKFYAEIVSPDGVIEMIFAYESDAIRWIKQWHKDRSISCPPIESYGPVNTGGTYSIA